MMGTGRDFWKLSAVELASLIRERRASCVEIMESVLGRIAAHNGELNAIVLECGGNGASGCHEKGSGHLTAAPLPGLFTEFRSRSRSTSMSSARQRQTGCRPVLN